MESIERINPFIHHKELMYPEHLGRYMFAGQFVGGSSVIDCSCGNGYGSYYLARRGAASVLGIDIDPEAVHFSRTHYSSQNLIYKQGDATNLDWIPDNSIDCYVSFETIEHIAEPNRFLSEVRRILRTEGYFIVSCPNDHIFNPENPYHLDTYTVDKFLKLLSGSFPNVELFLQNNISGTSVFKPSDIEDADEYQEGIATFSHPVTKRPKASSDTWVAVCSEADLPTTIQPVTSFFTTYSEYIIEVQNTINSLYEENRRLASAWEEHTETIRRLENEIQQRERQISELNSLAKTHAEYISSIEEENKRLAAAWQTHVDYIHGLEERLKNLEK